MARVFWGGGGVSAAMIKSMSSSSTQRDELLLKTRMDKILLDDSRPHLLLVFVMKYCIALRFS